MAGRQCKEMQQALALYDRRKPGQSVRDIATKAGVSHTGLYNALRDIRIANVESWRAAIQSCLDASQGKSEYWKKSLATFNAQHPKEQQP